MAVICAAKCRTCALLSAIIYFPSFSALSASAMPACSDSSARCRAQNWGPAHSHTRQLSGLCSFTVYFSFLARYLAPARAQRADHLVRHHLWHRAADDQQEEFLSVLDDASSRPGYLPSPRARRCR
jgi:hypothetical protein